MRLSTVFVIVFVFHLSAFSQFEGLISYQVTYQAIDIQKQGMISMLPTKSLLYLKDDRSLFEQEVAGGGKQAFIIDAKKGSGILVMQFLGHGYKVEMSQEEIGSLKQVTSMEIIPSATQKNIAGYECIGALAVSGMDTTVVYYSTELESKTSFPLFANMDGIPLQYELSRGGIKMRYTATEVKEMALDESIFTTAPDMKTMKFADFAQSFAISQ